MVWVRTLCLVLAALSSCKRYTFEEQVGGEVVASKKEVTIDVPSESDILFVLDNSGSMGEEIDNMRCSITGFVEALSATGNRFRVAVTTTDNQDQAGGNCDAPPGLASSVDPKRHGRCGRFLAPVGKPGFLRREDFATPQAMAAELSNYLKRDNSTITTGGSAVEQPLKSAFRALDPGLRGPTGSNVDFFRDDALLLIVIVSDESDCSYDDDKAPIFSSSMTAAGVPFGYKCYEEHAQLTDPSTWAARIVERKGRDRSYVRVGLISSSVKNASGAWQPSACRINDVSGTSVTTDECACFFLNPTAMPNSYCKFTKQTMPTLLGMNSACGQPAPMMTISNSCPATPPLNPGEGNCCIAMANERLFTFTNQFENLKDTICQKDFSRTLLDLANLADRQCFGLDKVPLDNDPNNVELKIRRKDATVFEVIPLTDRTTPTDGWYYENTGNPTACLSGAFKRKNGDTLTMLVVSSQSGPSGTTGATGSSR